VAPIEPLLAVVRQSEEPAVKVLAIRAVVAIVGRDRALPNPQKTKVLRELLECRPRGEEKRLIIGVLPRAACAASLQLAVELLTDAGVADEAAAAVAQIGPGYKRAGIRPERMRAALEKAAAQAKIPRIQNQIRRQIQALQDEATTAR
jgi:hypothetical protein